MVTNSKIIDGITEVNHQFFWLEILFYGYALVLVWPTMVKLFILFSSCFLCYFGHESSSLFHQMSRYVTKPTKWHMHPVKTQISLGICPVWSVFAVCSMDNLGPKLSSCGQWRLWSDCGLIRLGGCPGWSESSLGALVILLVLSCGGSYLMVLFWPT